MEIASALHIHGIDHIKRVLDDMRYWLEKREYTSLWETRGCLSRRSVPDASPFDRGNYIKTLSSYSLRQTVGCILGLRVRLKLASSEVPRSQSGNLGAMRSDGLYGNISPGKFVTSFSMEEVHETNYCITAPGLCAGMGGNCFHFSTLRPY